MEEFALFITLIWFIVSTVVATVHDTELETNIEKGPYRLMAVKDEMSADIICRYGKVVIHAKRGETSQIVETQGECTDTEAEEDLGTIYWAPGKRVVVDSNFQWFPFTQLADQPAFSTPEQVWAMTRVMYLPKDVAHPVVQDSKGVLYKDQLTEERASLIQLLHQNSAVWDVPTDPALLTRVSSVAKKQTSEPQVSVPVARVAAPAASVAGKAIDLNHNISGQ